MTGIDELNAHLAELPLGPKGGEWWLSSKLAGVIVHRIQAWLRERGVLLGPDGLIKAERTDFVMPGCVTGTDIVPLYMLIPQDPTEEP